MTVGGEDRPITAVREGMRVVDADGDEVGTVDQVQLGDPEATTTQGEDRSSDGLLEGIASAFTDTGPDVHPQLAARLTRTGYLKVDPGLGRKDRFAAADQVERVADDVVYLTVQKDQLAGGA